MNSLTVKILTGLLSVLIITTIGSQIYSALTERHDTEEAVLVTINEDIAFKGVIIRDEKVVTYDGKPEPFTVCPLVTFIYVISGLVVSSAMGT